LSAVPSAEIGKTAPAQPDCASARIEEEESLIGGFTESLEGFWSRQDIETRVAILLGFRIQIRRRVDDLHVPDAGIAPPTDALSRCRTVGCRKGGMVFRWAIPVQPYRCQEIYLKFIC
jgi:hypothetical protein